MDFTENQHSRFEKATFKELEKAYRTLCDMEVEYEHKLETIREVKARTMVEIELRLSDKSK